MPRAVVASAAKPPRTTLPHRQVYSIAFHSTSRIPYALAILARLAASRYFYRPLTER